jgi:leucyl/phenylalanyl-tRNA--protein transferase
MLNLTWLEDDDISFPPLELALEEPNGLLAAGGDLSPERLIYAYSQGIFPWYEEGQPPLWWSPSPRLVLLPEQLHIPRSLAKTLRKGLFRFTADTAFEQVIRPVQNPEMTVWAHGLPRI